MRSKILKLSSHISYLSKIFLMTSSIWSKLWKTWFSLSLHVKLNYNDLWNGCKVFVLCPSKLTNTQFNYWFNFYSLNYKQRTDIFHFLSTFTLFVFFLTLLMELFSNRAFVGLEDNIRNTLNSTQGLLYPKLMSSSDRFCSLGGCCLKVSRTQLSKWLASS